MKYFFLLFLALSILSCESSAQSINIPDKVEVKDLDKKINVKGTGVLINESNEYKYYDELKRFQKDSKNYFQIVEVLDQHSNKILPNVINKIHELEKQGGKLRVKKEIKLGVYDAYFALAPQGKESEQIILGFGDSTFTVLVMGVFQNDDKERKEITDLVLSTYYDKNIKTNIEDNLFYSVDLVHSEFKLLNVVSNVATYTINKEKLTGDGIYINNFIIGILPSNLNNFDLKTYSDKLIYKLGNNIYKEKNIQVKIISEEQYKEGENEIIKVEMSGVFKGGNLKIYQYIKQTPKGIIQFIGTDISKNYIHFNEYKNVAEKIKLK